jgi:hypothetical protein
MKKILMFLTIMFVLAFSGKAAALDPMVFDSTDNYLGGCQLTDTSTWTLTEDLNVTTFQIWYNWAQGETTLPITVTKDGGEFATFTATRGACDPYQATWCNADYALNKVMPKGTYATKIENKKQCLKPGSTGTVKLYGNHDISASPAATSVTNNSTCTKTNCTNTTIMYSVISFVFSAIIFYFVGKRK